MSSLPPFGQILEVRPEVAEDQGILDMVNLAHVGDKPARRLAAKVPGQQLSDPAIVFGLIYQTEAVRQTLQTLRDRNEQFQNEPGMTVLSIQGSEKDSGLEGVHRG